MVGAEERRKRILERLSNSSEPVTGTDLAAENKVSRQVIVQDMAVLRASGADIQAGPSGYRLLNTESNKPKIVIAVKHKPEDTGKELYLLVDLGIEIIDVIVEHDIYGEIRGYLHLSCRDDVDRFLERLEKSKSILLSEMTEGIHLHTVTARSRERLDRALNNLRDNGFLVE